jgi:hypothetical protein
MITEINGQLEYGIGCEEDTNRLNERPKAAVSSVRAKRSAAPMVSAMQTSTGKAWSSAMRFRAGATSDERDPSTSNQETPNDCAKLPRAVLIPDA